MNQVILGDCLEKLKELEDNSVDAVVTDPPYGLSFMGKKWDYDVPSQEIWEECLRVLKPGGYLLAFAGTRTQHRMAVRIEDAGFEIRDLIFWTYASGFPKSTNIFKQLQKNCTCGNLKNYENRNEWGIPLQQNTEHDLRPMSESDISQTINPETKQGQVLQSGLSEQGSQIQQPEPTENVREGQPSVEGWNNVEANSRELSGNDLCEMSEGVFTNGEKRRIHNATQVSDSSTFEQIIDENGSSPSQRPQSEEQQDREPCAFCKQFGTQALGALGLGSALKPACEPITVARKPLSEKNLALNFLKWGTGGINIDGCRVGSSQDDKEMLDAKSSKNPTGVKSAFGGGIASPAHSLGRFPANLIHDGSDEVVSLFPNTKSSSGKKNKNGGNVNGGMLYGKKPEPDKVSGFDDDGSASRFFYCAKASKSERNKGCEELEEKVTKVTNMYEMERTDGTMRELATKKNNHPTVKPIALMEYLVKLVSREGAVVLDPFAGSGSTLIACKNLGRKYIGIEREPEYVKIIEARLNNLPNQLLY
jgi:DNA modification methylase